jgi:glycosyltransferase involved in cell wall biosynthesis
MRACSRHMSATERRVLHVLPHAGGGGDTYVDVLSSMPGYSFTRRYLAPQRKSGITARGIADALRALPSHDLLHVHGEGAAALLAPALAARKSVVTLHGLHLLRRVTGWQQRLATLNLRAVARAADMTICVSHAEENVLRANVNTHKTVVVHNGATAKTVPRADLRLPTPVGIWVGSLDERRDPVAIARAAERAQTTVLFVGEGALRADVERAAGPHVRLLGQRNDVPNLLTAVDFFVLMSQREGLSFALLEAMAYGLPAIVTDIPENLEAIGQSGIAVPYGDEESVAEAMRQLADADRRATLGERARQRAQELFSAEQMVARTRAIYDGVLAE